MTLEQEHALYLRDKHAWARYVAPRRAQMLASANGEEKRRMWGLFGPESREAIRALKGASE